MANADVIPTKGEAEEARLERLSAAVGLKLAAERAVEYLRTPSEHDATLSEHHARSLENMIDSWNEQSAIVHRYEEATREAEREAYRKRRPA